jgi:hypothetical protein
MTAIDQQSWYARRKAAGICICCKEKAIPGFVLGPKCYAKRRARERAKAKRTHDLATRRQMWAEVDWSEPNQIIADRMEVTLEAVRQHRRKAGKAPGQGWRKKNEHH